MPLHGRAGLVPLLPTEWLLNIAHSAEWHCSGFSRPLSRRYAVFFAVRSTIYRELHSGIRGKGFLELAVEVELKDIFASVLFSTDYLLVLLLDGECLFEFAYM